MVCTDALPIDHRRASTGFGELTRDEVPWCDVARPRALLRIDVGRRYEPATVIADHDAPLVVMDTMMMVAAQHDAVGEVGSAGVSAPPADVMRLAMRWRSLATGPGAAAVSFDECDLLCRREEARRSAEVEDVPPLTQEHRHDAGRCCDLVSRGGLHRLVDAIDRGVTSTGVQRLDIDARHDHR